MLPTRVGDGGGGLHHPTPGGTSRTLSGQEPLSSTPERDDDRRIWTSSHSSRPDSCTPIHISSLSDPDPRRRDDRSFRPDPLQAFDPRPFTKRPLTSVSPHDAPPESPDSSRWRRRPSGPDEGRWGMAHGREKGPVRETSQPFYGVCDLGPRRVGLRVP